MWRVWEKSEEKCLVLPLDELAAIFCFKFNAEQRQIHCPANDLRWGKEGRFGQHFPGAVIMWRTCQQASDDREDNGHVVDVRVLGVVPPRLCLHNVSAYLGISKSILRQASKHPQCSSLLFFVPSHSSEGSTARFSSECLAGTESPSSTIISSPVSVSSGLNEPPPIPGALIFSASSSCCLSTSSS